MQSFSTWFRSVFDMVSHDVDSALELIHAFSDPSTALIDLPEGELTAHEALCYARILMELGHDISAEEIVHEVIANETGGRIPVAIAAA
jgi:glycerate-2-kinase